MRSTTICTAITLPLLLLAACGESEAEDKHPVAAATISNVADPLASDDSVVADAGEATALSEAQRRVMQAQVVLERLGFSSGVIDGKVGPSFVTALKGFQEARDLAASGELDQATQQALSRWADIPATRLVTIPQSWSELRFRPVPDGAAEQADMEVLGYESMGEALAERFHTTLEVLSQLNAATRVGTAAAASTSSPPATPSQGAGSAPEYAVGQRIRVPNVGADRITAGDVDDQDWLATLRSLGVGTDQPNAARIVVDKSEGWLKVFDQADKLVATFTVTTGSSNDPLPLGEWGIKGVAHNPSFAYDPELFWDVPDSEDQQQLPPGPNGPVGVVWIDLTKEHYGIHGTPAPETIGIAQSHGCVRLTNWDAARLAEMVSSRTEVTFQQ